MEFNQHEQPMLPAALHPKELDNRPDFTLFESVEQDVSKPEPGPEPVVKMTEQRKQRSQRMAQRPQQMALEPVSDQGVEILASIDGGDISKPSARSLKHSR